MVSVFVPRFEPGMSRIRSRYAMHHRHLATGTSARALSSEVLKEFRINLTTRIRRSTKALVDHKGSVGDPTLKINQTPMRGSTALWS
jgi:hypothetical protein